MKWQDFINPATKYIVFRATRIRQIKAQLELVTPLLPPGRGIHFADARIIGRS